MKYKLISKHSLALAVAAFVGAAITISACKKDRDEETRAPTTPIDLKDYSVNPSLLMSMPGFEALKITTLISSDDVLPESQHLCSALSQMVPGF